ncbi:MAG: hypothetical protein APF76_04065 [Desulfitibacter sp. BRH_c19]|nr:MAG: hypothetical protein APF76_04065 [Desulfitibacter sp. BRH_c19]
MIIIQLSDLHMWAGHNSEGIDKRIQGIFDEVEKFNDNNIVCVICGDVTNRGNPDGYICAKTFCDKLSSKFELKSFRYVFCPGNHDIATEEWRKFARFDRFTWDITKKTNYAFSNHNVQTEVIHDWEFLIINSVYHGDRNYGRVDINLLKEKLDQSRNDNKIFILHHHLIPILKKERSATENAYELFLLAEKYGVKLILHGHQHMYINISVGKTPCQIIGVGSLLKNSGTDYSNQFIIISLTDSLIGDFKCFRYNGDCVASGTMGGFI